MGRCRCDPVSAAGCQCSFEGSDAINRSGSGTAADPDIVELRIDPTDDNQSQITPDGLYTPPPDLLVNPPRVQVRRTTDQEIQSSTGTIVTFDILPIYDVGGMYDGTVDPQHPVITESGLYLFHVGAGWEEPEETAFASFALYSLPGNDQIISHQSTLATGPGQPWWRTYVSNEWEMNEGDELELRVFQNTGAALDLIGAIVTARRVAPLSS